MRTLPTLLGSLLLVSACAPTPADSTGDTAAVTEPAFIGPDDFVHCGMSTGTVSCQYTPLSSDFPFQPSKIIVVMTSNAAYPSADLVDGASHGLASALGSADVMLMPTFVEKEGVTYVSQQSDALDSLKMMIHVTEGATVKVPLPVDIWPIALIGSGMVEEAGTDAYAIQLAPWTTYLDNANVTRTVALPNTRSNVESDLMLVVTHGTTSVTGSGKFCDANYNCQQGNFALTGAGIYNVSESGLALGGAPSTSPTPPASNDSPDMAQPASPVMPMNGDPDPTCGGANQLPCSGTQCDPHFVYVTSDNQCEACGATNQIPCTNLSCDDHNVYVTSDNQCEACGATNQIPCANLMCDDHNVFVTSDNQCEACGTANQIPCANQTCDAHLIYVSFDNQCEACGADGQPECAGSTCNAGLTAGFDGECHA